MYQGLKLSRPWLALVLVLFCLPLFAGLRSLDLETDEAIYSFAVERILEVGEWLQPKSSPSETAVFLEKPPLKFWIVAAPIRAGLLPNDEFGLRFWDAVFGAAAFLYVFATGSLLAGPVCGIVAVLLLFVHSPILLLHGVRTNNMEGPLFLSYCGGVFHFLAWARAREGGNRVHAVATGLYFVLGFMTKFVAVIFLPAVLLLGALPFRSIRARLAGDFRLWLGVTLLVIALVAPWFIYAHMKFGWLLWETMLAEHVYARFTTALNQAHVQPWNFYFASMNEWFTRANVQWLVPAGVGLLLVQSIRRRWFEGTVVVLWAALPLTLISLGTSKLYHYAYPFIPPLTIAAGYAVALFMMLAPVVVRKALEWVEDLVARFAPRASAAAALPLVRGVAATLVAVGAVAALGAILFEQVRLSVGETQLFKSSGLIRPCAAIVLAGIMARWSKRVATLIVALIVAWYLPIAQYKATFPLLVAERHPLRDASDCIQRVEAKWPSDSKPGLYVDTDSSIWHPILFYFRRIQPWTRQQAASPETLVRNLHDPASFRPSLVQELRYRSYTTGPDADRFNEGLSPPMLSLFEYVLLLPGPYATCSSEAHLLTTP